MTVQASAGSRYTLSSSIPRAQEQTGKALPTFYLDFTVLGVLEALAMIDADNTDL
jgi:hypothetical protein